MDPDISKDIEAISRIGAVQKILEVICRTTGLGFSAVARVTEKKWVACAVRDEISFGLTPGGELVLETTICDEIRQSGELVAIDHVAEDVRFCNHHTPKQYGFQSYISVPITLANGQFFGTLCAIDPRPAKVKAPEIVNMFKLFADLIAMHLDSQDRLAASEKALLSERETAHLREQFIAVLGHDLRSPLAAISNGASVLRMMPQPNDAKKVIEIVHRSATRAIGLVSDVLDFARDRLGGGMSFNRSVDSRLQPTLTHVVNELQTAWPQHQIQQDFSDFGPVYCDAPRIGQMLSNLIANALTHGDAESPVLVSGFVKEGTFELSVTNRGRTIPPEIMEKLFHPFARGSARPGQEGLGLGLYIADQIAAGHDGTLSVSSSNNETRFTFRMPVAKAE